MGSWTVNNSSHPVNFLYSWASANRHPYKIDQNAYVTRLLYAVQTNNELEYTLVCNTGQ